MAAHAHALRIAPGGFSRAGAALGPVWLASKGLWGRAGAVAAAQAAFAVAAGVGVLTPLAALAAMALLSVYVGLEGREWARQRAARKGRPVCDIVVAVDPVEAEALALRRLAQTRQAPNAGADA